MNRPDAVWIICGGWLQVPAVEAAHRLGLAAIVSDRNPQAPAMRESDCPMPVDIYDIPGHIAAAELAAQVYNIRGIFTEGADCEVTLAALSAHLGLPGISVEAARRCKNKVAMRWAFAVAGVSPVTCRVPFSDKIGWEVMRLPFVVKATDNCGSRGTHVVTMADEYTAAVQDAEANSTDGRCLIEEYLTGPQQSVEILFDAAGRCHWLNIVDRLFADDGVMELGHVNPTSLPMPAQVALYQMTEQAAAAVGVAFGAFKCDTIWTDKGPRILECTARLSGGLDCQVTTPASTGRDFITAAMRIACGMPPDPEDLRVKRNGYAAAWAAFPRPGRVKSIWNTPGMQSFIRVKVGDVIEPYTHCATRPAFVVVLAGSYAVALERAQAAAETLAGYIVTEAV